jgi:uncharacterized secreted repeat protein (TIGR03808 family)
MDINRRHLFAASAAGLTIGISTPPPARAVTLNVNTNATQYGIRSDSTDDQTQALQRGIDECARSGSPLILPPGRYRSHLLHLPNGAQIIGTRGATHLRFIGGPALLRTEGSNHITLANLVLDGGDIALPERHGLVHCLQGYAFRITDCEIKSSGGTGLWLENIAGRIDGNTFDTIAGTAIVSFDALDLVVTHNTIRNTADNGIEISRTSAGDDGTMVLNNRIDGIRAGPGGTGQHGNAINVFRAGNVIVSGNRISNCDYSAIRGNSANNIQIIGNSVSNVREVAIYSEFSFESAIIANNTIDIAAIGISVCNFNEGGRLAVVQGNIIRNLLPKRPIATAPDDDAGIGIYVEADTAVTGNVIEHAPSFGIVAGWGKYLRDVTVTGNIIRQTSVGIGISVAQEAGAALINGNVISDSPRGAIVGLDHAKVATTDLNRAAEGLHFAQIVLGTNVIR